MSPVHKLSQIGSLTGNKIDYPSMLAGYGDFGALQRIGWVSGFSGSTSQTIFNNIPQTFQDLMIVFSLRTTWSAQSTSISMIVNNTYSSIYSWTELTGNGSAAGSARITGANYGSTSQYGAAAASSTSGIFASNVFHILNYTNSTTFKTVLMRGAADTNGAGGTNLTASLVQTTSPIQQLLIQTNGNFVAGSTIALYGVRASAA
jgi:hypothetical protein